MRRAWCPGLALRLGRQPPKPSYSPILLTVRRSLPNRRAQFRTAWGSLPKKRKHEKNLIPPQRQTVDGNGWLVGNAPSEALNLR